jgi:hypothetical protein
MSPFRWLLITLHMAWQHGVSAHRARTQPHEPNFHGYSVPPMLEMRQETAASINGEASLALAHRWSGGKMAHAQRPCDRQLDEEALLTRTSLGR